ncbi:MAG: PAS domain S-box protein [Pseudobutyrivibrio sp.]|nr:PAS domain S-box protein [Pseudobutyrivibrio sp.]
MINNPNVLKNIFDNASEIICIFDKDGQIKFINKSGKEMLGFESDEPNIREVLPTVFTEGVDCLELVKQNMEAKLSGYAYRKNRSCFAVEIRFHSDVDENGQVFCVAYMNDIADLESQKKRLRVMEENNKAEIKARDEFTANLTHELRTPVNGIKGHIRNLKENEDDSSKKHKMDIVLQCCANMEKIIDNLLDFAKLENGKMILEEREFSLTDLINSSVEAMEAVAIEKGLSLTCHIADNVPSIIIGDEFRISQVINNLLNNAIKFTSAGHVGLDVYKTGQKGRDVELTFFVIDTGIGMSATDKDKLFKSFTQVDGSTTRQYGGTGLGLYVCKKIVDLMGGNIEVESEVGKGSTFIFSIHAQVDQELTDDNSVTIKDLKQMLQEENLEQPQIQAIDLKDEENLKKINSLMENIAICVELDNWDKAESFASGLKKLLEGTEDSLSKLAFRLVMNVRKEKKDECHQYLEELSQAIESL